MRKVAVFFGGKSYENEISILTGVFVLNVLDREKYLPIPIYVHTDGKMYTSKKMFSVEAFQKKAYSSFQQIFFEGGGMYALNTIKRKIKLLEKPDVALNCCHGGLGEGGGVSAMMEWNGIPLASPDLTASGIFLDKCATKLFMRGIGIPVVDYIRVNEADYEKRGAFLLRSVESRLKYPVIVKPSHLGSSIGIALAKNEMELKSSLHTAFQMDDRVIIERYLEDKKDINCAAYAMNGEIYVSFPESAFGEGIYSFEEKYVKRASDGVLRKGETVATRQKEGGMSAINEDLAEKIRAFTRTIYKRADLKGVVRMDFLLSEGKVYLCEVNTVPGSLAYYLFCERVSDARAFFGDLLEEAIRDKVKREKSVLPAGILHTARRRMK